MCATIPAANVITPASPKLLYPNFSTVKLAFCANAILTKRASDGCKFLCDKSILCNDLRNNASDNRCSTSSLEGRTG